MSCTTNANVTEPSTISLPNIPGFGIPFSVQQLANIKGLPPGVSDLSSLQTALQMHLPFNITQMPNLSQSFSKQINDTIHSLMEQAGPFLSSFRMLISLMKLIIGIIEVICSLLNPFTLGSAIAKLFNEYIPEFLSLFPQTAMIPLIVSIAKMILAFVQYMVDKLNTLVSVFDKNLKMFGRAVEKKDTEAIANISYKFSTMLCTFQNYLVSLAVISGVYDLIEELLGLGLNVPCQGGDNSSCCNDNDCPPFLQNNGITGTVGSMKYFGDIKQNNAQSITIPGFGTFYSATRTHMYQIYDTTQLNKYQFINMVGQSNDKDNSEKIFFPTDSVYSASTKLSQAPYLMDIRFWYNPIQFGRTNETARYIRFNNCIVTTYSVPHIINFDGSLTTSSKGVLQIAGGQGFEDDNHTILNGYSLTTQATLENFLFLNKIETSIPSQDDSIDFSNITYNLKPTYSVLFGKSIISAGCMPNIKQAKQAAYVQASPWFNKTPPTIPNIKPSYTALVNEIDVLASNLNSNTLQNFNNNVNNILSGLNDSANAALIQAFEPDRYKSDFTILPKLQWIGSNIVISILFKDSSGTVISTGLTKEVIDYATAKTKIINSLGITSPITYSDPYFVSNISSENAGDGTIKISYDNQTFAIVTISGTETPPVITENIKNYTFIINVPYVQHPDRNIEDQIG